jgi:hypothetical protein
MSRIAPNLLFILALDPLRRTIAEYLWFLDLIFLSQTNRELCDYVLQSDPILAQEALVSILKQVDRKISFPPPDNFNLHKAIQLAARVSPWPTDIAIENHASFSQSYSIEHIFHVPGAKLKCFAYQGVVSDKNRTVVGNDHFPVPSPSTRILTSGLRPVSSIPFTKVIYDTETKRTVPLISQIAYFEITIYPARRPNESTTRAPTAARRQQQLAPCVCIGIARPGFDIYNLMPGWDQNSYGYHGDDGLFFHGDSDRGYRFVTDAKSARFGEGDTVGLGIIYPSAAKLDSSEKGNYGSMFLTKNGTLLAQLSNQDKRFFEHAWFPAVGTDCYNPMAVNFGCQGVPFAFDVLNFEFSQAPDHPLTTESAPFLQVNQPLKMDSNTKPIRMPPPRYVNPLFYHLNTLWRNHKREESISRSQASVETATHQETFAQLESGGQDDADSLGPVNGNETVLIDILDDRNAGKSELVFMNEQSHFLSIYYRF